MLDPQDAQLIVAQVVGAEAAREGRDFIYTFIKPDGTSATGRVVDSKGPHLELLAWIHRSGLGVLSGGGGRVAS